MVLRNGYSCICTYYVLCANGLKACSFLFQINYHFRFTNDVIASAAFGVKCNSLEEPENVFFLNGKKSATFTGLQGLKFAIFALAPSILKVSFLLERLDNVDKELT